MRATVIIMPNQEVQSYETRVLEDDQSYKDEAP